MIRVCLLAILAPFLAAFMGQCLAVVTTPCAVEDDVNCVWTDPDTGVRFYSFSLIGN